MIWLLDSCIFYVATGVPVAFSAFERVLHLSFLVASIVTSWFPLADKQHTIKASHVRRVDWMQQPHLVWVCIWSYVAFSFD